MEHRDLGDKTSDYIEKQLESIVKKGEFMPRSLESLPPNLDIIDAHNPPVPPNWHEVPLPWVDFVACDSERDLRISLIKTLQWFLVSYLNVDAKMIHWSSLWALDLFIEWDLGNNIQYSKLKDKQPPSQDVVDISQQMAKVFGHLATGEPFGEQDPLKFVNDWIEQAKDQVLVFANELWQVNSIRSQLKFRTFLRKRNLMFHSLESNRSKPKNFPRLLPSCTNIWTRSLPSWFEFTIRFFLPFRSCSNLKEFHSSISSHCCSIARAPPRIWM